ncbi:MAG: HEPN domain-containing protein [Bdellovibrionales bacterium]|jgi:HEPN domain-containing protein|nr:HEPN domain-containing protein [Bdellovibrionales bacterium]
MTKNLKKQLFPKEYARELLTIAKGDLESAVGLSQIKTGRPENIVFIVQQSIEKSLKAVLVHLQIPFPLVHDLGILVALLPDEKAPPEGFALAELNPFASVRRYEEGQLPLTAEEIKSSLDVAQKVIQWAIASINS